MPGPSSGLLGAVLELISDAVRAAEDHMLAAAAGHHAPGRRKVVVALERGERTVAIVARVDVEHDSLSVTTPRLACGSSVEPFPDHGLVGRGVEQPARHQPAERMLGAARCSRPPSGSYRPQAAVDLDRPGQRQHRMAVAGEGERGVEDRGCGDHHDQIPVLSSRSCSHFHCFSER